MSGARYRVVNGTPGFAANIMLLDTYTGRSWVICDIADSTTATRTNWCAMHHFGESPAP